LLKNLALCATRRQPKRIPLGCESPGVFQALRDPAVFRQVHLDHGAVTWPGEIDLAPDAMYDDIRNTGRSVPA